MVVFAVRLFVRLMWIYFSCQELNRPCLLLFRLLRQPHFSQHQSRLKVRHYHMHVQNRVRQSLETILNFSLEFYY